MIDKRVGLRLCALTAGLLGMFIGGAAQAATIIVNSLADPGAPGICALRDAITAANTMTATNGCAAGSGNDTINFPPRMTGTISLVSTLPEVTDSLLTINGPASRGISISGGGNVPVMGVATNATLNVNSLTIADGRSNTNGGGIVNLGILTVTSSSFSGNLAFGAGGGILNDGPVAMLTVVNSTFSGNSAGSSFAGGGAIYSGGLSLTVLNCTFYGNSAAGGGGIFKSDLFAIGTATVTNSTFSGNAALGTIFPGSGGGGVNDFAGDFTIKNTIFAASIGGNCIGGFTGGITDAGYNISDDASCGFTKTGSANNGDGIDPLLSAAGLADNGGPTQTIGLQSGSPAIDAIPIADCTDQASSPNPITTDQRGFPRPDAGEQVCDIGAYEFQDFAGQPGARSCQPTSYAALTEQFGSLGAAASALGFPSSNALQSAIAAFCKG